MPFKIAHIEIKAEDIPEVREHIERLEEACNAFQEVDEMLQISASLLATPEGSRKYADARLKLRAALAAAEGETPDGTTIPDYEDEDDGN